MVNKWINRLLVPVTSLLCCLCCCLVWWGSLECGIAHSICGDLFFWVWIGSSNLRSSNTLIKDILGQRWRGYSLKAVQIFMCFVGQSGMSSRESPVPLSRFTHPTFCRTALKLPIPHPNFTCSMPVPH